ncbi:YfgM family protein [Candidatus Thioglobus sp.]|uniref:YfgM family protein n=1 Tax=Candidatus Thioglobus sp. TaxID=2026721 RepID=UPI003D0B2155
MKNFIEVGKTEDEQEEQVKKWIKENGLPIVASVALGLGGIWGFGAYKTYQSEQAVDARALYLDASSSAYKQLSANHADSSYQQQAVLMQAKIAAKAKNYELALQYLSGLVDDENTLIANIAALRVASIQLETGDFKVALATLDSKKSGEFDGLFNQLKADIYVADKQIDKAKEHYQLALTQLSKNSELQSLINIKLADLN